MKENYRRTLTSWLRQIEGEITEMRDAIDHPRDGPLLAQRIVGSQEEALAAVDAVLEGIEAIAIELLLGKSEEDVIWSANVQLLTAEISVGELLPERWHGGPDAVGEPEETAHVGDLLHGLLARIKEARASLRRSANAHQP